MHHHVTRLLAVAAAALFLAACGGSNPSTLHAGERTEIRIGFSEARFGFEVDRPAFYTLFTDGDVDTVCRILDASGVELAENDDSGRDLNCALSVMLRPGNHTVVIGGFEFSDRGRAYVTIEALPVNRTSVGEAVHINLTADRGAVQELEIDRAGYYLLSTAGRLDTECTLFDSEGRELGYSDDHGDDLNCALVQRLDPGRYFFVINSYAGEDGRATFMAVPTEVESYALAVGQPHSARLENSGDLVEFNVRIDQAGRHVFRTSGETDTECELYAAGGALLDSNDDASDHNCGIRHFVNAGHYRFVVRGYAGTTGSFTAHVESR